MNSDPTPHPYHQRGDEPERIRIASFAPAPLTPRRSKKHIWFGLGGIAIGLLIGSGLVGGIVGVKSFVATSTQAAKSAMIADAYETCTLDSVDGATLSPDEMSIDFSGAGKYIGPDFTDVYCLGDALGMPDAVSSRMGQTRALDGTQTADWDSFTVSWNYHPDDGLGAIFEYVSEP